MQQLQQSMIRNKGKQVSLGCFVRRSLGQTAALLNKAVNGQGVAK
jgi:hypothetical protein